MSSTTSVEPTDPMVEALVNFSSEIFSRHFVMDMATRRQVITDILSRGKIFEQLDHNYDLMSFVNGTTTGAITDPSAMKRNAVVVTAGLSAGQRNTLVHNNPDVDIKFVDAVGESHQMAYAQRIIDTARCISLTQHRSTPLLDIGGNWATALMQGWNFEWHACTLRDSENEAHRQTQRQVLCELQDIDPAGKFCTCGTEKCDFKAPEGICIHALPEIDPDLMPSIFRRHELRFLTGVHHYDVDIEIQSEGYIPDAEMNWITVGDSVRFFFEGDSSHPYEHKREYLLEYARCWVRTMPDWDYVVYYSVDYIRGGILKWTMVRMLKSSLSAQQLRPQFRFLEVPDVVELTVPQFDSSLGLSISSMRSYKGLKTLQVPRAMFAHLYRSGDANETHRPDQPLSYDDVLTHAHAFNAKRTINGTSMTKDVKFGTEYLNDVALGMYLFIVRRAAESSVSYSAFTSQMKRVQSRMDGMSVLQLITRATGVWVLWPFISPFTSTFQQAVDVMSLYMRRSVQSTYQVASAAGIVPYRVLPPIRPVTGALSSGLLDTDTSFHDTPPDPVDFQEEMNPSEFLKVFGDQLDRTSLFQLKKQVQDLQKSHDTTAAETVAKVVPDSGNLLHKDSDADTFLEYSEDVSYEDYRDASKRLKESLVSDGAEHYKQDVDFLHHELDVSAETKRLAVQPRVGTQSQVNAYSRVKVYEYGLYNVDVGLNTLASLKQDVMHTWRVSTFDPFEVQRENDNTDRGLRYLKVVDQVVQGVEEGQYVACMDPITYKWQYIVSGNVLRETVVADYVAVNDQMRIFNNLVIARKALNYAKRGEFRDVTIELVDGVPGCGKTYSILQQFNVGDVILCAVRDTADDTRSELAKKLQGNSSIADLAGYTKGVVRTVDSANMHDIPKADTLYVDEGLMVLPGAILLAAMKSHCKRIVIYGDQAQIKFIERGTSAGSVYFSAFFFYTSVIEDNISKRVTADALYIISQWYPEHRRHKLKTMNPIRRGLNAVSVSNEKDILFTVAYPTTVYLSVLQADKNKILGPAGTGFIDGKSFKKSDLDVFTSNVRPVYSTHEAQGRTFPDVVVVRLNVLTVGTFDSFEHLVVNLSRHTVRLRYVSLAPPGSDELWRQIDAVLLVPDEVLDGFMEPTPKWLEEKIQSHQDFIQRG